MQITLMAITTITAMQITPNGNNNNNSNANNSNGSNNNNSNANNSNGSTTITAMQITLMAIITITAMQTILMVIITVIQIMNGALIIVITSNNNSNNNEQKPNQNQEQSATSVTLEQHGIIVTVHKVEQADNIVRVKYTINNTTNQTIFPGAPGAKIEQKRKSTNTIRFQRELDQRGYIAPSYKCRWNKPLFIERYNK